MAHIKLPDGMPGIRGPFLFRPATAKPIAGRVAEGGKRVRTEDVERARREGATDKEIHDTVLIAAAFCMFNRYVDGLATWAPEDPESYRERAASVARDGYAGLSQRLAAALAQARGDS
jgi:hypothetical protein